MSTARLSYPLPFLGGWLCLDFANTVDWRLDARRRHDVLTGYDALLAWSEARHSLPPGAAKRLATLAKRRPASGLASWQAALALRTEIWAIAEALEAGREVPLGPLNRRLAALPPQPPLTPVPPHVHALPAKRTEEVLWPVLWSLTALLASEDAGRVRCCQAAGCGWFFVDASPNRARLWCSAKGCGNRERVRRAYARRKVQPKGGAARS
ncbi:MAG: CGNR zinc finger domain-containing protein [Alphaproteobacteria bacterium]